MVAAHLNEPTIESAHEAYLVSFDKLPSVQETWGGKRPTLKQYKARFGKDYEKRQKRLAREQDKVLATKTSNELEDVLYVLAQGLGLITEDNEDEPDDEYEDEPEDDEDNDHDVASLQNNLIALLKAKQGHDDSDDEDDDEPVAKRVRPENEDLLPTTGLVYFYLHRAAEQGDEFAIVPVRRIVASQGRTLMAEGASYDQTIRKLRKSVKA